ncbi:hypothetical protein [Desulfosporosinus sp. OT]|uniref:hypothetical protein n=1 Tax=Desulfosporosinus sp. OT TaxID=913865 RepID=UPI00111214B9|nr:hypothetical protein [Desulfosporosinus sp. OT]
MGSGVHPSAILYPTPLRIPRGITASAILSTGDYRAKSAVLGALAAAHIRWPAKTLSLHVLALLTDTVFARISLLAGWPSVPEAHEDTVFARISLLAGWREGTVCAAPHLGSVA